MFAVRLFGGGKELDRVGLFPPSCGPASPTMATRKLGADRAAMAWETNDEHCDTQIAARTVDLGPTAKALLVTELAGFEYRYRSHTLYLPKGGALDTAWRFAEDTGATHRTAVTVIPGSVGAQDLAFIEVLRTDRGDAARFKAERLHLDPASGRIVATPLPDASAPLFVLQVGRFKGVEEALKADRNCLADLDVLRSKFFARLHLPVVFHGAVFARRADADEAAAALATCSDATKASVVEMPVSKGRSHANHH